MTFRERQIYRDNEEINGCLGRRKMNRQNAEFQDSENTLYGSHNDGYMSLYCCPDPQNSQHHERTLFYTMGLG